MKYRFRTSRFHRHRIGLQSSGVNFRNTKFRGYGGLY